MIEIVRWKMFGSWTVVATIFVLFETTFSTELKFNSAVVYPGRILHAANIDRRFSPPKDKSEWRLTVTALLESAQGGVMTRGA